MTPRLSWVVAIVALLGGNMVAMIVLATIANNGTNQVIPDYYARATHYDQELDRAAASRTLGWRVKVAIVAGTIDVMIADAAGEPVTGAGVRITGYQRAHAAEPVDLVLSTAGAGHYRGVLDGRRGWYDLIAAIDAHGAHDTQHLVVEAR